MRRRRRGGEKERRKGWEARRRGREGGAAARYFSINLKNYIKALCWKSYKTGELKEIQIHGETAHVHTVWDSILFSGLQIKHTSLELSLETKHQWSYTSHGNSLEASWTLTVILQSSGGKREDPGQQRTFSNFRVQIYRNQSSTYWCRYIKQLNTMEDPKFIKIAKEQQQKPLNTTILVAVKNKQTECLSL